MPRCAESVTTFTDAVSPQFEGSHRRNLQTERHQLVSSGLLCSKHVAERIKLGNERGQLSGGGQKTVPEGGRSGKDARDEKIASCIELKHQVGDKRGQVI